LDLFGLSRSPSLIFGSFVGPLSFRRLTLSPGLALIEATKRSGYKTRLSRFFALRLRCRSLLCLPLGCLATPLFLHRRFAGLEFRPASLGGLSLEVVLVCLDQPLGDRLLRGHGTPSHRVIADSWVVPAFDGQESNVCHCG
jgi:hypothetical protein